MNDNNDNIDNAIIMMLNINTFNKEIIIIITAIEVMMIIIITLN